MKRMHKAVWFRIGIFFVIALAALGYLSMAAKKTAPDVVFFSLSGEQISMQSLRGQVVVVNFWATSCVSCIREMPRLVEIYEKYRTQGLNVIAVAMSYDPPNYVIHYAQSRTIPFVVALDVQGEVARSFNDVKLTPTTYLIDREGRIIQRYVGEPDFAAMQRLIEKALAD
jgi:peroxiredoxin